MAYRTIVIRGGTRALLCLDRPDEWVPRSCTMWWPPATMSVPRVRKPPDPSLFDAGVTFAIADARDTGSVSDAVRGMDAAIVAIGETG